MTHVQYILMASENNNKKCTEAELNKETKE